MTDKDSQRALPGMLGRSLEAIWQFRFILMIVLALAIFLLMMFAPSEEQLPSHWERLKPALAFALLFALLGGWFACLARTVSRRQARWCALLLLLPPVALIYLHRKP